ncbi:transcriptional regulator [Nakamurella sp. YIM 132087]|uniref:Transcriptional regulator n=1 Tax=Nakamurella alba TaxID=2665158 RepID=A0A7K1FM81_9ACTN|nr:SRPBCC domain-containing protein [Nakamurella alba]MTD15262.1 transcriptional regulator [Nakamurella alba]
MTSSTTTSGSPGSGTDAATTQVYKIYIKASAEAIWTALTDRNWTARWGFGGYVDMDLRPGGHYEVRASKEFRAGALARGNDLPEIIIEGEVLEVDAPHRLVHSFHMLMDPGTAGEAFTTVTYEIVERPGGMCSLTMVHELAGAPQLALIVGGAYEEYGAGGGHAWTLSDLKSLLETGSRMSD